MSIAPRIARQKIMKEAAHSFLNRRCVTGHPERSEGSGSFVGLRRSFATLRMTAPTDDSFLTPNSGFTLVEVMISVALVLFLVLGINAIFRTTSDTIGGGQAALRQSAELRNAFETLNADFSGFCGLDSQPVLMIYNQNVVAFRDQTDQNSDTQYLSSGKVDDALLLYDAKGNSFGPPRVSNTVPASVLYNNRNHRIDIVSFFSQGSFRRQTGGQNSQATNANGVVYQSAFTSDTAYIWYGHVRQPSLAVNNPANDWGNSFTYLPPGMMGLTPYTALTNPNNFFANQWVLGRMAILLADPQSGVIPPPNAPNTQASEEFLVQPNNPLPLSPFRYGNQTNINDTRRRLQTSLCDLAGVSLQKFRDNMVRPMVVNPAGTRMANWSSWFTPLLAGNRGTSANGSDAAAPFPNVNNSRPEDVLRFACKPWSNRTYAGNANAPLNIQDDLALQSPAFIRGCSQFIVEFAGDFVEQHNLPAPGQPINANSDKITAEKADGVLDFDTVQDSSGNFRRRVRWYGLERKYPDNGLPGGNRHYFDVRPLYRWLQFDLQQSDPLPFEKVNNSDVYPVNQGADTIGYTCAWSPYEMQWLADDDPNFKMSTGVTWKTNYPNGFMPWMIRLTIRVDDPSGKLPDGQTIQYIFNLPHP
jgi:prepilin-type N-terminal cleavage/methylation domain-containing protein